MKPHQLPEWLEYCESAGVSGIFANMSRTDEDKDKGREIHQKMDKMSMAYEDEDTEMLVRIVKLRKYLW